MTVGGLLLITIVILQGAISNDIIYFEKTLFLDAIVITLLVNTGFFINFGLVSISYQNFIVLFWLLIYIISSFFHPHKSINTGIILIGFMYLIVISFGTLISLIFLDGEFLSYNINTSWDYIVGYGINKTNLFSITRANIFYIFRNFRFVLIGIVLHSYWEDYQFRISITRIIKVVLIFQISLGFIDFGTKFILDYPFLGRFNDIFWGSSAFQVNKLKLRVGLPILHGFMREPYYFALSFLPGIFLLTKIPNKKNNDYLLFTLTIILLILTGSLTGFALAITSLLLLILREFNNRNFKYRILLLGIFLILSFPLFSVFHGFISHNLSRILSILGIIDKVGSENVRIFSIKENIHMFLKSPIFGCSIGSIKSHGFIPTIFANIGIIGLLSWLFFIQSIFKFNKRHLIALFALSLILLLTYSIEEIYGFNMIIILFSISDFTPPILYSSLNKIYSINKH